MISGIDTFYAAFKTRMGVVNPARLLGGILQAADWPPKEIIFDAFYLVVLGESAVGKESYSWTVPVYIHTVQFQWVNSGTDINNFNNVVGHSRGDRYRISTTMKGELLNALFPGFTQKVVLGVVGQTITTTPQNEAILWTRPTFISRLDKESGKTFELATVRITDLTDSIAA